MRLEPTSERMIVEAYQHSPQEYLIYLFHTTAYDFALKYSRDKQVLDFGCGTGYGTASIADKCARITGIDIAEDAIAYAQTHYPAPRLDYRTIEPVEKQPLPFADASFDTVLSFQVIEHIQDVESYLNEIRRVLKTGGVAIFATPNGPSRLFPFQKPWNKWHVKEYGRESLEKTIRRHFERVELFEMGGRKDVIAIELARTRKLKWITLPLTLSCVPEPVRRGGLGALKRVMCMLAPQPTAAPRTFSFDESAITIQPTVDNCVNLLAVAHK